MIEVQGLTKSFGRLDVLRGVDLAVTPGRVTALVGPNGAGKTTLLKAILGLTHPDRGGILVNGAPIDPAGAYRRDLGYMPQIARYPDNLCGNDLIETVCLLRGAVPHDETLVDALGIRSILGKPLRQLSGGSRQKVNAVIAFLFAPAVLILDEPTAGLDPVSSGVLKDAILAARDQGRTVIVSSHVMSELEEIADDVAFLFDGVTRYHGPLHDLRVTTRQFTLERAIAQLMSGERAA